MESRRPPALPCAEPPARPPFSRAALTLLPPPPPARRWLPAAASRAGGGCCCCNFRFSRAPTSSSRLQVGAGQDQLRPAGRGRAGGCGNAASPRPAGLRPAPSIRNTYFWSGSVPRFFQPLKKCSLSSFKMATGELLVQL